ncbi:Plasmid stabilization system protein [Anatilimnocola aggregata]|uniref:Plasmid stabilization system protein n=1 Tax=Anatilimnocola aggregata TaxID=2528021 RepID=A0A517Y9K2_9BACT|nr:Plasmid stabilization system protein [Anatilimnocola aggregata]
MIVKFDSAAKAEFDETLLWYGQQSFEAALRFSAEIDAAIRKIADEPKRFSRTLAKCQRCELIRFPYSVIFFAIAGKIRIVAIAHHKRRPGYWRRRV